MNIKKILIGVASSALMLGALAIPAFAATETVYDALPSVSPITNYPSQPFQAQQTNEFGDYIHLGGTGRMLNNLTVTMSNWALESTPSNVTFCENNPASCDDSGYFWPITVNIYANTLTSDVPNNLLGTKTVAIHVPWRPESPACSNNDATGWQDSEGHCNHGLAFNAVFDLSDLSLTLPDDVIIGFVYNTQTYGPNPTTVDGPYNSLNIAVPDGQTVSIGTDDNVDSTFWNTNTIGYYSNLNCTGGTFCLDTSWTPNGTVALKVEVEAPPLNPFPVPAQCDQNISYNLINGSAKSEKINGTGGNDLIYGNGGSDKIDGKGGNDCIVGGSGSDKLIGGNGDDVILGGDGSDSIEGNNDADKLYGEGASDSIKGGNGADELYGGDGSDSLKGEAGNDMLDGQAGVDSANGGANQDTCTAESENSCEL